LVEFEGDDGQADKVAAALADSLEKAGGWYADFHTPETKYVVFAGRVFRFARGDLTAARAVQEYARSVGQRDERYREAIAVPSIADRVRLHPAEAVHGRAGPLTADATEYLDRTTPGWWVHIDLDVLRWDEFPACAAASDPAMPGGLGWNELTTIVRGALSSGNCRGLGIGVYNTDLDPDQRAAHRIVRFLNDLANR
jgi:arginase family enzyme